MMTVFCDVAPCSLTEIDRLFRGDYCLHHQGDDRSDDYTCDIPEDSHLHPYYCLILNSLPPHSSRSHIMTHTVSPVRVVMVVVVQIITVQLRNHHLLA
jgi:hypothetical protein